VAGGPVAPVNGAPMPGGPLVHRDWCIPMSDSPLE
jgi:hypothetical protein